MKYMIHSGPGLGDIIQMLSMARSIKENDNDANIDYLLAGSKQIYNLDMELIACQNYVDQIYWYSKKTLIHNLIMILKLKKRKYDYGIVRIKAISKHKKGLCIYYIMRMIGCKKIVGTGTDKVDIYIDIPEGTHYLDRNAMLLNSINIPSRKGSITIDRNKLDIEWLKKLNIDRSKIIITLSVGTNKMVWKTLGKKKVYDVKSWEYKKWLLLSEQLTKLGYIVILIGGYKEKVEIEKLEVLVPNSINLLNMIGKTSIRQSLSLLSISDLVVGSEGGMMHCANALGTDTLTIFGGTDERMWNPGGREQPFIKIDLSCSPCFCTERAANCNEHKCLDSITVDMVLERILRIVNP